jgi:phenylacetic acid degradation operon negative regulatory protein
MKENSLSAAAELVVRFRRQKPLRAGSLIVTMFGDAIMPRGGVVSLGSLIGLGAPFGLSERLVRTATSRLAQEGWLEGRRAGKLSEYQLSAGGRIRFAEATRRIYSPPESQWSGRWTLAVLPPMPAPARKALQEELTWRGFGELSPQVFAHPEPDSRALEIEQRRGGPLSRIVLFDAALAPGDDPRRLAALGWDLDELGARYRRFVKRFEPMERAVGADRELDPRASFIVRTLLIHEYRRLHLRDPMLPARLLEADWPGARAARLCREIYSRVFVPSEAHLSRVAAQLQGPLPPPDPSVLERFGGLSAY